MGSEMRLQCGYIDLTFYTKLILVTVHRVFTCIMDCCCAAFTIACCCCCSCFILARITSGVSLGN